MSDATPTSIDGNPLTALPDVPDYRDRWYEPTLLALKPSMEVPEGAVILDQKAEGACTGFGLAAVINRLHREQGRPEQVSARMLYEMAKRNDEWQGADYAGSSCRGAIKGWYHAGVCQDKLWPYKPNRPGDLTIERAKNARAQTLGAYYRIRKTIVDMHAALNEVGAVYVSATVHSGWAQRAITNEGHIKFKTTKQGGHAFAVVGYDKEGFWIQNSWGKGWGLKGLARWSYEDWMENVSDAWVVQLALSTPALYSRRRVSSTPSAPGRSGSATPRRDEIAGHFVHIDDGRFSERGKFWSTLSDVKETAQLVAKKGKYKHLLIYAHGGLNSVAASARRIAAMRDTFKDNGIYPFHFMYDTGLMEELKDIVLGKKKPAEERAGGFTDWTDRFIEKAARRPGRALWREMKSDAKVAFKGRRSPGTEVLKAFLDAFAAKGAQPMSIHLVGHSTGAILHAHLVQALAGLDRKLRLASVSLLAPACSVDQFRRDYVPHLKDGKFGIDQMDVYNLNKRLERDDSVAKVYRKSLLYLVARSFEEDVRPPEPLLGLEEDSKALEDLRKRRLHFHYSNGIASTRDRTNSTSHGGFDNDPATMNSVLKRVLGVKRLAKPFTKKSLSY